MTEIRGFVLFGDVVRSRTDAPAATAWLRELIAELARTYPPAQRLAAFAFSQGDELQGLLRPTADPFLAVLRATLNDRTQPMRWAIYYAIVCVIFVFCYLDYAPFIYFQF